MDQKLINFLRNNNLCVRALEKITWTYMQDRERSYEVEFWYILIGIIPIGKYARNKREIITWISVLSKYNHIEIDWKKFYKNKNYLWLFYEDKYYKIKNLLHYPWARMKECNRIYNEIEQLFEEIDNYPFKRQMSIEDAKVYKINKIKEEIIQNKYIF